MNSCPSIMMQVQARMDDIHTRDVTSEMQPLCLIGKEMRAAFWRGQYCYPHSDHRHCDSGGGRIRSLLVA